MSDITTAFNELTSQSNDNQNWWLLTTFENNEPILHSKGTSGFETLKKSLDSTKIMHGVFKVLGVDDRGNVVATRPKIVAFTYVGSNVGALKRGQAGPQRDRLKKLFLGVHCELQIDDLDDFTRVSIAAKLLASGGAHKPTRYEFGPASENDEHNIVSIESLIGQKHT